MSAEEMVLCALERGFSSLGFSEHASQPIDPAYGLSAEAEYILEIQRLKAKYADRIRIFLGIERDAESSADRSLYEYVIGSVHYFRRGDVFFAADGRMEDVVRCRDAFFGGDGMAMARAYYDRLAGYVESYRPDIIGHFDVIRKQNDRARLFDTESAEYRNIACEALERMIGKTNLLEVNTGGIARGYVKSPYPELFILRRWRELGGRVVVSSDCHDGRFIDAGYDAAYSLIAEAGFKTAIALGAGDELWQEYWMGL